MARCSPFVFFFPSHIPKISSLILLQRLSLPSVMSPAPDVPPEEVLNVNVGILGHVDSGKTSLVKSLSTLLSTAALDKSTQSRQRGMTLDLGFSCFFLEMPAHLKEAYPEKKQLQITLVDCPGHASLIRTIIGGAQIIDMVLLVVDGFKGWQAQTTECLVLAELTSPHLIVALNKIDLFAPHERQEKLEKSKRDVRSRLQTTRFNNAPIIGVSACVGGEKVAATTGDSISVKNETHNMDLLVQTLQTDLPPPRRLKSKLFYFSIDHCFQIKGQGTVMTGTVLSGSVTPNQVVEFPTLGLERKVKSMQMFRRKVQLISQGDRAGICVANFDSKILERGIAATPGAVQLLKGAIALIRKVPYFPGKLASGSKFHISVGHTTVMATATFWGGMELLDQPRVEQGEEIPEGNKKKDEKLLERNLALGGEADIAGLPHLKFNYAQNFLHQDQVLDEPKGMLHWAMLDFQTPVYCPLESLVIGSRFDTVDNMNGDSSSCRLAFSGRLVEKVDPQKDISRIKLYTPKERRGVVSRLGDPHRRDDDAKVVRYEVFGDNLFKAETNMKLFVGMKLETERGEVGEIKSSFGTSGKFRVFFPGGTEAKEGDALILKFKRYSHDAAKEMHQDVELPAARCGARIEVQLKKKKATPKEIVTPGEVNSIKGEVLENGKFNTAIISGFFSPEVSIRERAGFRVVIPLTKEEGKIAGPFGKAGKCKVIFDQGISADAIGAKAELYTPAS